MSAMKLVAHRGYMHAYPENTRISIEAALQLGADYVELDVQMCADGELVVIHDDTTDRTAAVAVSVFDVTLSELKKISVHFPDKFRIKYQPEMLVSLAEIMQLFSEFPDAIAMVEIKEESIERWGLEKVMQELLQVLQPWKNQCCIISFSADAIDYVKRMSKFTNGWVLTTFDEASHEKAQQLKPGYLICNYEKVDTVLWAGNWVWMLYDIIDPVLARDWNKAGAELIETANIESMIENKV